MQIQKIVFAIIIGYIFGVGTFYFFVPANLEKKTDTSQNPNSTELVELVDSDGTKISKPCASVAADSGGAAAPPCPCLFSDKILGPPEFDSRLAQELKTNMEGEVLIRWVPREGAKRYSVLLETEKGALVKSYSSTKTAMYLKEIPMPRGVFEAKYVVKLTSHNGKDEAGPKGKGRVLLVKAQASVLAPEVQEIKVEE